MKKILFTLFSAFLITGATSVAISRVVDNKVNEAKQEFVTCKYGQCKATAKSTGQRCKHCVSNSGDSYCYQHK